MDIAEVGSLIRQERIKKGLTQKDLAAACGLSRATVNGIESGKAHELGFGRVAALGGCLGLEVSVSPKRRYMAGDRSSARIFKQFQKRYIWWKTPGSEPDDDRIIAQVMDIGTYGDVKMLEHEVGRIRMRQVLSNAEPGWFSPKSWDFWRMVLGLSRPGLNSKPPRRTDALHPDSQNATRQPETSVASPRRR